MKACPRCGALNEDQYLYCYKCNAPLPSVFKLNNLRDKGRELVLSGRYREALHPLKELVNLNPADKEGYTLLAIAYRKLTMYSDIQKAYDRAGIKYRQRTCYHCNGTGICPDCGGEKICVMCKGTGRCHMCHGSGVCYACNGEDPGCPVCAGSGKCPRCGGSGECVYCGGTGYCRTCNGSGLCPYCGGTRIELVVDVSSVMPQYRRFFED